MCKKNHHTVKLSQAVLWGNDLGRLLVDLQLTKLLALKPESITLKRRHIDIDLEIKRDRQVNIEVQIQIPILKTHERQFKMKHNKPKSKRIENGQDELIDNKGKGIP